MGIRGRVRSRGLVHGARAYLAGAGTTGSLLAVAALVFIVASALVAFRGWPHVAAATSPGQVVVSPRPALGPRARSRRAGSRSSRQCPPARAVREARVGPARRPAPSAAGRGLGQPRPPRHAIGAPVSASVPVSTAGARRARADAGHRPSPTPSPSPTPVRQVQQTLSPGDEHARKRRVGHGQPARVVGAADHERRRRRARGVSTPAGGAVSKVGSGAAKTVTGATQALGGVLKGLGR